MTRSRLSRVLFLLAFAAIAAYLWWHWGELRSVVLLSPFYLILCAFSTAIYLTANGLVTYATVNKLGTRIGISDCLGLSVVTSGMNAVVPIQGGSVVRAVYLNRFHNFQYSRFLATLIGCQVLIVIVSSLFAAVAVLWMAIIVKQQGLVAVLGAVVLCLVISVIFCFVPRIAHTGYRILDYIAAVLDAWHELRAQPRFLATLTALVCLQVVGQLLAFWTACAAIGIQFSFAEAVAIGTLGILASLLSITPGALGIYEAVVAVVGTIVAAVPAAEIVLAALLSRVVLMVLLLVLTPFAISFLHRQTSASVDS